MISLLLCAMMGGWLDGRIQATDLAQSMKDIESLKGAAYMARVNELAAKIKNQSEETVTQTYLRLSKPEQRGILVGAIASASTSDCRYVPLLMTIVQFDDDANVRSRAATALSEVKPYPGPFRESAIVLALGEALMREENQYTAEHMAAGLDSFLRKSCKVDIGGWKKGGDDEAKPKKRVVVLKIDVEGVKAWWNREGRSKAIARGFDVSKPAS